MRERGILFGTVLAVRLRACVYGSLVALSVQARGPLARVRKKEAAEANVIKALALIWGAGGGGGRGGAE